MLCLKAEVLDDSHRPVGGGGGGGGGGGFILPMNLGSSIHRFLWKSGKGSRHWNLSGSFSCGDESQTSSGSEDSKPTENRSGQEKGRNMGVYKYQLEQDVKTLQKQLQEEVYLHLALAKAVERSNLQHSNSPSQLPDKAQELLDSTALMEITVSKLEQELVALQYQLIQERNERRIAEYRLRHLHSPESSLFNCSPASTTEQIMRPFSGEKLEGEMDDMPLRLDVIEEPNKNYVAEYLWHHPNQLSEEMVLCMRDIFLFLADSSKLFSSQCMVSPSSPQGHLSYSSFTSFSDSPMTLFAKSPLVDLEHGCEVFARKSVFDPYKVPGKVDWTGSIGTYSMSVEVCWLSVGKKEFEYAAGALKRFRFLVDQLAQANLSCMTCNEKLAFWINLYNALIMHAYLAYGIPKSDTKLCSLMQKAAYTVGGHSFSAADIEYTILKRKPPSHSPQMALVLGLRKFKISEEQKMYSIDHPEPLLTFALSCGMHSSPAVRIFRPGNVIDLLKTSLKDYVQASVGISNKGKLLVPKLLHCFAEGVVDDLQLPKWICQFLSPEQAAMVRDCSSNQKRRLLGARSFTILPFDSRFRYLFLSTGTKELP